MVFSEKVKRWLQIEKVLASGRNQHVDALKGIAITFVVFAHTIQINHPLRDSSYLYLTFQSFAMPLFMLLSGYIISSQVGNTLSGHLKKYALRLLVPFFIWAVVSYIFYGYYNKLSLPVFLWGVVKSPGQGLWFLWTLFMNSVFLFAVLKLVKARNWVRWENYFVIAAIIVARTASADVFGLSDFRLYFPYYAAGFFACKYQDVLKSHSKIIYAIAIVVFPLLLLGYRRNAFPTFYPYLVNIFGETGIARLIVSIYKYVIAFAGMAFASFVLKLVRDTRFYLFWCWIGTLSLDIYVCHEYFILRWGETNWQYFVVALLALACSLILTLVVLKRSKITRMLFLGERR